jgi:hypothetical protein
MKRVGEWQGRSKGRWWPIIAGYLLLAVGAVLQGCGPMRPADPAVTARIVAACTQSGLFKAVDGAVTVALPAAALPVMVINAGVDIVCANPARFAADISTVEWVVRNLPQRL